MNKKKFLKLHSSDDNTVIIVCVNEIILIYTDTVDGNKVTTVYFDNEALESITVNETPEKIYQFILDMNNTDFVKLHSSDDNAVIVINTECISLISQVVDGYKKYTTVYFNNDSVETVTFNESPERIYQMIEDTITAKENKK